mgnify:CR=1 FL=1
MKHTYWIVAAVAALLVLSNVHFITGKNVGLKVTQRDSMGFSEMFINVDQITGMPFIMAQSKYPLGCQVLVREGMIESMEEIQARVMAEAKTEMDRIMRESQIQQQQMMQESLRQQKEMMRAMGY